MPSAAVDPSYFQQMYERDPDPWGFATSDYERDKYAATLAALPDRRFASGLEIGCSIGVLSHQVAARCDAFLGLDVVESAVAQARTRCADRHGARFAVAAVPGDWPVGRFDLIVFSEVLYYLGEPGLQQTADRTRAALAEGGVVVLVNWLGETGAGVTGDAAAEAFIAACALPIRAALRTEQYRVDVLG